MTILFKRAFSIRGIAMKTMSITCLALLTILVACGGSSPEGSLKSFLEAPKQDNQSKFLRYSLKAQKLAMEAAEDGMTVDEYFEKWKNDQGEAKNIEAYGAQRPFLFENRFQTEAITYTVTFELTSLNTEVDNSFQLVLITEEIKERLPWISAEKDQWVVMDNLIY
jgi:hypothetical protein